MNHALSLRSTILLLAGFTTLLVGAMSFGHMEAGLPRLWLLASTEDGRVAIQFDTRLYLANVDSGAVQEVDLAHFGKSEVLGGFDFFTNGDVLVSLESVPPNTLDQLKVLARQADDTFGEGGRLFRCSLSGASCRLFSSELPPLNRTFRVFIDTANKRVYVSDTSRHQVFVLDTSGKLLATKAGLRFPNKISMVDGELWLADTNHHRLVQLAVSESDFGRNIREISTRDQKGRIWPSSFARVVDQWWVLLSDSTMSNGIIVRYDNSGKKLARLQLPSRADPLDLTVHRGRVLISDYRHYRIYQFDFLGNQLEDLKLEKLTAELDFFNQKQRLYNLGKFACWGLFALCLISGFVIALRQQLAQSCAISVSGSIQGDGKQMGSVDDITALPVSGVLLEPSKTFRLILVFVALMFPVTGLAVLLMLTMTGKDIPLSMQVMLGGFPLVMLLPFWPVYKMLGYKLRVFSDRLQLIDYQGNKQSQGYQDILWAESGFLIHNKFISVADPPKKGLFKREDIEALIKPRFYRKNQLGRGQIMIMQAKESIKNVETWIIAIVMISFLIGMYFMDVWITDF